MEKLTQGYWENRYLMQDTGWDIGQISAPFKAYFDQLRDKNIKILIPGCGNAYEAEYLIKHGFTEVYVLDWSASALKNLKQRLPAIKDEQLICGDFFQHQKQQYDLIIEQTFFCALPVNRRNDYVEQMHRLLKKEGKLVGLLFNVPLFTAHPPFGGNEQTYRKLFDPYFDIMIMETCYNSIEPRKGNELFIKLQPKIM
jgi:SAM-dependent methyltransferase